MLELLVVLTFLGILAATVAMRYGRSLFAEFGSQATARELSLALLGCQRASINTGDDHYLEFLTSGGQISSYRIMRIVSGVPTLVDGPKPISADVTVTSSDAVLQYNFEGSALGSYSVDIAGESRTWRVDVIQITGAIRVTQTS